MKDLIDKYPLLAGVLALMVAIALLFYRLKKKDTLKMSNYSTTEWSTMAYSWGLIIMCFLLGLYLIINSNNL